MGNDILMTGTGQIVEGCMKGEERVPWTDLQHPDEYGWTRSSTVRPMTREHNPGYVDWVYYSPDGLRLTSIKRARAYMDGMGVKQIVKISGGGTHIRWQYRDNELKQTVLISGGGTHIRWQDNELN